MGNYRDIYSNPDTGILYNRLGITDRQTLENAEYEFTSNRIAQITTNPLQGQYDFTHFCSFHQFIFQDVYEWAGQPRTVPIEKAEAALGYLSIAYAKPGDIVSSAQAVLQDMTSKEWNDLSLDEQTLCFADTMANLWQVHAFREGNTRTTVTFLCQFIESRGIPIDRTLFQNHAAYTRRALVAACAIFPEGDFRKPQYLHKIVRDSFLRGQMKEQEKYTKPSLIGRLNIIQKEQNDHKGTISPKYLHKIVRDSFLRGQMKEQEKYTKPSLIGRLNIIQKEQNDHKGTISPKQKDSPLER